MYYEDGGITNGGQVQYSAVAAMTFCPEPKHEWDAGTLK